MNSLEKSWILNAKDYSVDLNDLEFAPKTNLNLSRSIALHNECMLSKYLLRVQH